MIAVLQRVTRGKVEVGLGVTPDAGKKVVGSIERGLVVLLGIARGDGDTDVQWMAKRIVSLRIFSDESGKTNWDIRQAQGSVLLVSQFTLLADLSSGNRPGFSHAEVPEAARIRCGEVAAQISAAGIAVEQGEFGAHMLVTLENDGPVTIVLDSKLHAK